MNYRYHKELSAKAAVKSAGLDSSSYFSFGLSSDNGLFSTYSTGKLPFDVQDNGVVEIGWAFYPD